MSGRNGTLPTMKGTTDYACYDLKKLLIDSRKSLVFKSSFSKSIFSIDIISAKVLTLFKSSNPDKNRAYRLDS